MRILANQCLVLIISAILLDACIPTPSDHPYRSDNRPELKPRSTHSEYDSTDLAMLYEAQVLLHSSRVLAAFQNYSQVLDRSLLPLLSKSPLQDSVFAQVATRIASKLREDRLNHECTVFITTVLRQAKKKIEMYPKLHFELWRSFAIASDRSGDGVAAAEGFQREVELRRRHFDGDTLNLARAYNNLGVFRRIVGDAGSAIEAHLESLALRQSMTKTEPRVLGNAYQNLGLDYLRYQDYFYALEYLQTAMRFYLKDSTKSVSTQYMLHTNIGNAYHAMGKPAEAWKSYQHSMALRKQYWKTEFHDKYAPLYKTIGNFHFDHGQFLRALDAHLLARENLKINYEDDHPKVANASLLIGRTCTALGSYAEAQEYLDRAAAVASQAKSGRKLSTDVKLAQAELFHATGRDSDAIKLIDEVLELANIHTRQTSTSSIKSLDIRYLQHAVSALELLVKMKLSDDAGLQIQHEAIHIYDRICSLMEEVSQKHLTHQSRFFLATKSRVIYEAAIELAFELFNETGDKTLLETTFNFMERNRANVLQEMIAGRNALSNGAVPDSFLSKERKLRANTAYYELKLANERDATEPDLWKIHEFQQRWLAAKEAEAAFDSELQADWPAYHALKYKTHEPVSAAQIQATLDDSTAFLEYFIGDSGSFLSVIRSDTLAILKLDNPAETEELASSLSHAIRTYDQTGGIQHGTKLYQILIAPAYPLLKDIENLVIVPDASLHYIPFDALVQKSPPEDSGQMNQADKRIPYLVYRFNSIYHYSASLFHQQRQDYKSGKLKHGNLDDFNIATFAPVDFDKTNQDSSLYRGANLPRLPFTLSETKTIRNLFESRGLVVHSFNQSAATERALREYSKSADILHLATHAMVDDHSPALTAVVFAPDDSNTNPYDGMLHLGEIYMLELDCDLVTLSACETGTGLVMGNDGPLGLSRAFVSAGARNVVATLWRIADERTESFMTAFYKNVARGKSYAVSLREAKLTLLSDDATAVPFFWSGFNLTGPSH